MKPDLIIARYGEVGLKSNKVRRRFENRLINNIKASIDAEVKVYQARIFIFPKDFDDAIEKLERIFGIVSYSPAISTKANPFLHMRKSFMMKDYWMRTPSLQ